MESENTSWKFPHSGLLLIYQNVFVLANEILFITADHKNTLTFVLQSDNVNILGLVTKLYVSFIDIISIAAEIQVINIQECQLLL